MISGLKWIGKLGEGEVTNASLHKLRIYKNEAGD